MSEEIEDGSDLPLYIGVMLSVFRAALFAVKLGGCLVFLWTLKLLLFTEMPLVVTALGIFLFPMSPLICSVYLAATAGLFHPYVITVIATFSFALIMSRLIGWAEKR